MVRILLVIAAGPCIFLFYGTFTASCYDLVIFRSMDYCNIYGLLTF